MRDDAAVLFIRAVAPTGENRVPMPALRDALSAAGLHDVRTYIQSGNVIARSDAGVRDLERLTHDVIREAIGPDLVVIGRPAGRVGRIVREVPFTETDGARIHITLLATRPSPAKVRRMLDVDLGPDRLDVRGSTIYARYATSEGASRFTLRYFERSLGVPGTTRGYGTMSALARILSARA